VNSNSLSYWEGAIDTLRDGRRGAIQQRTSPLAVFSVHHGTTAPGNVRPGKPGSNESVSCEAAKIAKGAKIAKSLRRRSSAR
jgi:hypothetical protein